MTVVITFSEALRRSQSLPRESTNEYRARKAREHAEIRRDLIERDRLRQLEILRRDANLGERFATRTFETWRHSAETEIAFEAAQNAVGDRRQGAWLYGPVGTGKTHLIAAAVIASLNQGVHAAITTTVQLLDALRASYDDDRTVRDGQRDVIAHYAKLTVLAIDDLGKERFTPWSAERMFELINGRYETNLPLLVTSNQSPTELVTHWATRGVDPHLGEALVRRIAEMCGTVVQIGAAS